jgi:hypothetical protein
MTLSAQRPASNYAPRGAAVILACWTSLPWVSCRPERQPASGLRVGNKAGVVPRANHRDRIWGEKRSQR